jgi:hypothetical protein
LDLFVKPVTNTLIWLGHKKKYDKKLNKSFWKARTVVVLGENLDTETLNLMKITTVNGYELIRPMPYYYTVGDSNYCSLLRW